jgi:hypothetical protein
VFLPGKADPRGFGNADGFDDSPSLTAKRLDRQSGAIGSSEI